MSTASEFESHFFRRHDENGVTVLDIIRPKLTEEENLDELDQEINSLLDTFHVRRLVLDLNDVIYMTSAAIGKLISLHRRLMRGGGQLVLCSLQPEVSALLGASHLLDYFKISSSPASALSNFS